MLREGLGEDTEFSGFHPWVNLIFFILAIGITMFSQSIWYLAVTTIAAWTYSVMLGGVKQLKMNVVVTVWSVVMFALINGLFVHNGATVLFYISGNRITLEAILYGISMSVSSFMPPALLSSARWQSPPPGRWQRSSGSFLPDGRRTDKREGAAAS